MKKLLTKSALTAAALTATTTTFAAPPASNTYFGSAWSGIGFVLGYGNEAAYVKYACNGTDPGVSAECDGPPRQGLIRKFTEIVDSVITAAKFTTCTEVPTSGTKTVSVSGSDVVITFGTPKQSIPAGWTGGGTAFERRMDFSFVFATITIKAVFEASCTYDKSALMSMNMLVGSQAVGYERPINLWTGVKDGNTIADVLTIERTSATGEVRSIYGYNVEINDTTKNYKLAGAHSTFFDGGSGTGGIDVLNINGNFNTHQASMRVKRFIVPVANETGNPIDSAKTISSMTGSDDALLTTATDFGLLTATTTTTLGPVATSQGCIDFDTETTAPTAATACTGLDFLTTVPAPANDPTGKFSAKWIVVSAKGKLVEVPTP